MRMVALVILTAFVVSILSGCDVSLSESTYAYTCGGLMRDTKAELAEGNLWEDFEPKTLLVHRSGLTGALFDGDYVELGGMRIQGWIREEGDKLIIINPDGSGKRIFTLHKYTGDGLFAMDYGYAKDSYMLSGCVRKNGLYP